MQKNFSKKIVSFFIPFITIFIIILSVLFVKYLYSIDFSLKEHLSFFSYDTHYFKNFDDEYKSHLETQVEQVNTFLKKNPDFFECYENYCIPSAKGVEFYKKDSTYPENIVLHKVALKKWEKSITINWPNDGFGVIKLYKDYPNYLFFENDNSHRLLLYTGGERPKEIIEKFYKEYNSVLRFKLADGWYDIIPFDKK
jgi:hypothetical protein